MSSVNTGYEHVQLDGNGVALVGDPPTKIWILVAEKNAHGWSPEELHFQHPHLTLGEIHSALGYYWDHKEKMDQKIEEELEFAEKMREATDQTDLKKELQKKQIGITVGRCVKDLSFIVQTAEPADLRNQVIYLPL